MKIVPPKLIFASGGGTPSVRLNGKEVGWEIIKMDKGDYGAS